MRALQYEAFGNPIDQVELVDVPKPQPKAGEVLLRLTHRAVNPADLLAIQGQYPILPDAFPAIPGGEAMGEIEALGEGVAGFEIGQRVVPLGGGGKWQESIVLSAEQIIPVPETVSSATAAQLIVNPVTVYVMMLEELDLKEGEWFLQTAAGSTLGRIAIQLAKLRGIKTVNIVRRREQIDELLALGGDAAFSTQDDNLLEQILEVTGGGVQGATDAVGGEMGLLALESLQHGGMLLSYGLLSGQSIPVDSVHMLFNEKSLKGFWLSAWFRRQPQAHINGVVTNVMTLMAQGQIVPPVEAEYDLADYAKAFEHMRTPGRSGKILLVG
ncbi:MAG: zinc-dependent alcohol dehydrogenase family protein [Chloroflexi bacterium]|nr:zinc-dependent alcohol dehydrogenase family protein [Chloroflexota bacterium]